MKTHLDSPAIPIENELSRTHADADSQLFLAVEFLEIPQRLLKSL